MDTNLLMQRTRKMSSALRVIATHVVVAILAATATVAVIRHLPKSNSGERSMTGDRLIVINNKMYISEAALGDAHKSGKIVEYLSNKCETYKEDVGKFSDC